MRSPISMSKTRQPSLLWIIRLQLLDAVVWARLVVGAEVLVERRRELGLPAVHLHEVVLRNGLTLEHPFEKAGKTGTK